MVEKPAGYVCPLSPEACQALEQLAELEQTQAYNIQQCGLCGLDLAQYKARSDQRMQLIRMIQTNFPPTT